ncbi:ABC transporter substrate-binding protein [Rhodobacter capsulatus]|uniref:Iron complex transport system substrate-binding protein n=1 Tax=Rhodobacter capsulatus TaxID=1061 RepID=A0A1G7ELJ6_RHOCA|nr:ABC transporter substrate-binding protein [Rhodobacter capsulatus]WER09492.1 ABC transporter substrate-binding protein [Rhodobacter capsulatus]SDE64519.1 iron complex transport system substrate-binding protein [Rhodobacter capsulatus]
MRALVCAAVLALVPGLLAAQDRVLSIGGGVTEVVAALGEAGRLVGRDTTSTYPATVTALPDVGYMRALSPEGVLSVAPDLILLTEGAGPPETLETLRETGVKLVPVPEGHTPEAVLDKVRTVAAALGVADKGEALAARLEAEMTAALAQVAQDSGPKPRVLFILSNAGGRLTGAGAGTSAAAMIALAGGQNVLTGFDGYKALGDEAIATAAPEVILMMARTGEDAGGHGAADLASHPALAATPAAKAGRVVRMDGMLLLGFGPRTPEAISALHAALAPKAP